MKRFDRDNRTSGGFGGGRSFDKGGRGGFDRDNRRPSQSFPAVCSKCGKDCTIPFRPSAGRPVYCNDCFERPTNTGAGFVKKDFSRPSFNKPDNTDLIAKKLELINTKLDMVLKSLEAVNSKNEPKSEEIVEVKEKKEKQATKVAAKTTKAAKKIVAKKKK